MADIVSFRRGPKGRAKQQRRWQPPRDRRRRKWIYGPTAWLLVGGLLAALQYSGNGWPVGEGGFAEIRSPPGTVTRIIKHAIDDNTIVVTGPSSGGGEQQTRTIMVRPSEETRERSVSPSSSAFSGTVTQVVDGDTIRVSGHDPRIRLFGIDAAEMDSAAGRRAKARMQDIAGGKWVSCRAVDVDRYGRTVAICKLSNGQDIGGRLIADGYAQEFCRYSLGYYGTCG